MIDVPIDRKAFFIRHRRRTNQALSVSPPSSFIRVLNTSQASSAHHPHRQALSATMMPSSLFVESLRLRYLTAILERHQVQLLWASNAKTVAHVWFEHPQSLLCLFQRLSTDATRLTILRHVPSIRTASISQTQSKHGTLLFVTLVAVQTDACACQTQPLLAIACAHARRNRC